MLGGFALGQSYLGGVLAALGTFLRAVMRHHSIPEFLARG